MQPSSFELQQSENNLKILRVFHYVYAGLTLLGLVFLVIHYLFMNSIMSAMPTEFPDVEGGGPAPEMPDMEGMLGMFVWFYVFGALICLAVGIGNVISANFLGKKQSKIFSMVVAGVNCLNIPLGTILGVFTFVVLMKPATQVLYGELEPPATPQP